MFKFLQIELTGIYDIMVYVLTLTNTQLTNPGIYDDF